MVVYCLDCDQPYDRADEEIWRVRCRRCYFNFKHERQEVRAQTPVDDLWRELLDNLKPMLSLVHPEQRGVESRYRLAAFAAAEARTVTTAQAHDDHAVFDTDYEWLKLAAENGFEPASIYSDKTLGHYLALEARDAPKAALWRERLSSDAAWPTFSRSRATAQAGRSVSSCR